jgi:anti-sigma regulatory factor (Ser/Thr protein kinase)
LPGDAESACAARALVRRELRSWGAGELVDDCSLIVTELVTNAIRHGGSALILRLSTNGAWVYGEVFDEGEGMPCPSDPGLDATGGRGLLIVGTLSDEWGVADMPGGGKIVWFLLGCDSLGELV